MFCGTHLCRMLKYLRKAQHITIQMKVIVITTVGYYKQAMPLVNRQ